jgi:hypothetical protein
MKRYFSHTVLIISVFLCFSRCAQVVPLSGGPRDTIPPKLLESLPSQASVNFNSSEIVLRFNEFIQLRDLKNQLVISPKLKTEPEISADGKKINILLKKEELQPNTTYRIYFGKAIVDMTEANPIPNFEYVFSTGAYIDSLKVSGTVSEAFTERPLADVVVGLYTLKEEVKDSVVYKETPDYLTRTLTGGDFRFVHLPKQKFRIVAFQDKNKNYIYDGESEKIGFKDKDLEVGLDSNISLKVFQELPAKTFIKKTMLPYYGIVNVIYNKRSVFTSRTLNDRDQGKIVESVKGAEKDTVTFYYTDLKDSLGILITDEITKRTDTIKAMVPKLNLNRMKTALYTNNLQNTVLPLGVPFRFSFFNLSDTLKTDHSRMHLIYKKDSLTVNEPVRLRYVWPAQAEITNTLKEGVNYTLKIDSAALYDVNGKYNDSSLVNFRVQSKTDLGKVTVKVLFNLKQSYVVQLLNEKEQMVREENVSFSLSSSNAASIDFTNVPPGSYTVKVIFDDNGNKKWDTGNYLKNKQPEKVFISSKVIKALPDWEVEEEILIK